MTRDDSPEQQPTLTVTQNGGSRPVPDPTLLTGQALERLERSITDRFTAELAIRDERLRGIDVATKLRLDGLGSTSPAIDDKVNRLADLTANRFESIQTQFRERDVRSERESQLNKIALDAAFSASKEAVAAAFSASKEAIAAALLAQKESAAEQNRSNTLAITKSEAATQETINKLAELFRTNQDAQVDKIDDIKERVSRIESIKVGATENRTGLYAAVAFLGTVIAIGLTIAGVLASR